MFVKLGFDVSTRLEDAVPEIKFVEVGETEVPSPLFEPIAVAILPEDEGGDGETELPSPLFEPIAVAILPEGKVVVTGTISSINVDVRKQTYHMFLA